jgi:hypothetical protein
MLRRHRNFPFLGTNSFPTWQHLVQHLVLYFSGIFLVFFFKFGIDIRTTGLGFWNPSRTSFVLFLALCYLWQCLRDFVAFFTWKTKDLRIFNGRI